MLHRPLLLLAALLVGACSSGPADAGRPEVTAQNTGNPTTETDIVRAARTDLAERLGVSAEDIAVVEVSEVTWRDGSIGCPRPDMAYAQVLVNGSRIVLRAGDKEYHYHVGGGRGPFYCAEPAAPLPSNAH